VWRTMNAPAPAITQASPITDAYKVHRTIMGQGERCE
jgi:hypothetical protein